MEVNKKQDFPLSKKNLKSYLCLKCYNRQREKTVFHKVSTKNPGEKYG